MPYGLPDYNTHSREYVNDIPQWVYQDKVGDEYTRAYRVIAALTGTTGASGTATPVKVTENGELVTNTAINNTVGVSGTINIDDSIPINVNNTSPVSGTLCIDDSTPLKVNVYETELDVHYPLATDSDSVYVKDIDLDNSNNGDFVACSGTGSTGTVLDYFNSLTSVNSNSTTNNPKIIKIWFKRTVYAHEIGLGCHDLSTDFGNSITIKLLGSGEAIRYEKTFIATNPNSFLAEFGPKAFNGVQLEFNTSDTVCLSNITIGKSVETRTTIHGLDPNGNIQNVGIQLSGSLRTSIENGQTGKSLEIEPLGSLKSVQPVRLVGTTFSNGTKDTNFWTEVTTGSGTVSQSGQIELSTGITANSTVKYYTNRNARKITGTANQFRAVCALTTIPELDNIRRIGSYDIDNGFFFQINGTTMQVGSRKNGSDTLVSSGDFNGNYGIDFTPDVNILYRLIIDYTTASAKFFMNGILLHTISNNVTGYTNTLNLPVAMENINLNGNTTDNKFIVEFSTILRLGGLQTENEYKFISTNTTTVCKYNAGRLKRVTNVDNAGSVTIYDNTAATGTIIATIDTAKALGSLEFEIPFSNGLTVVTATGAKVVVIYE